MGRGGGKVTAATTRSHDSQIHTHARAHISGVRSRTRHSGVQVPDPLDKSLLVRQHTGDEDSVRRHTHVVQGKAEAEGDDGEW